MQFPATPGWGPLVVGGPPPILAQGRRRCSPPFLAGVCCLCSWVVGGLSPTLAEGRLWAPRHSWLRAPGAVLRHSWLGPAHGGAGCCFWCGAVVPGLCVFMCCVCWVCGVCVCSCGCGVLGVLWSWWAPRQSWLLALGAVVPRHSRLGSGGGSGAGWSAANPG